MPQKCKPTDEKVSFLLLIQLFIRFVEQISPEESASFLSKMTIWWCNPLILLGFKKPLTKDDMWSLNKRNRTAENAKKLERTINKMNEKKNNKLNGVLVPLVKTYWVTLICLAILNLIISLIMFVNPIVLNWLISFISNDEPEWRGYFYCGILFFSSMFESILRCQYEIQIQILGMNVRSCIVNFIYQKVNSRILIQT